MAGREQPFGHREAHVPEADEAHALEPDAAGEFAFTSLGEGRYELRAIRDGVELARSESETGANVVMRATLAARGPTLVLRVHDEEGTPCTRMRVDGGPFRMAWTDTEGQVEAPDVFSGSLALSLRPESAGSGIRETIQVPLGEQGRRIEVEAERRAATAETEAMRLVEEALGEAERARAATGVRSDRAPSARHPCRARRPPPSGPA